MSEITYSPTLAQNVKGRVIVLTGTSLSAICSADNNAIPTPGQGPAELGTDPSHSGQPKTLTSSSPTRGRPRHRSRIRQAAPQPGSPRCVRRYCERARHRAGILVGYDQGIEWICHLPLCRRVLVCRSAGTLRGGLQEIWTRGCRCHLRRRDGPSDLVSFAV